jgi:Zn-dependent protease with chaperone function
MTFVPNALCFGSDLPGQGIPCHVDATANGLVLAFPEQQTGDGAQAVSFNRLSLAAGGFDHDQLVVKWEQAGAFRTLYIKDAAAIASFRRAAPPELMAHFDRAAASVRQARATRRTVLLAAAGMLVVLVLGIWFGSDALVRWTVGLIPVEWEQQIGEAAMQDILAQQEVVREGPVVEAVQAMTERLTGQIPDSPYPFTVTVVKSPVVNAFALPGGSIVVYTGLVRAAGTPEEVAGVLGHEINHVLQRHGLARIVKTLGVMAVAAILLGDRQGLIGLARQLGVEMVTLKYGRDQETEADLTGLRLLHKAKVDPAGMIAFFERLAQSEKEQGRVELLSTHPMSTARAKRLKAELKTLPTFPPEPFTFDWEKVQGALKSDGGATKP